MTQTTAITTAWEPGVTYAQVQYLGDRMTQEDAGDFRAFDEAPAALLAVLADGMGGHASGEVASNLAVTAFCRAFSDSEYEPLAERLSKAVQVVNSEMSQKIISDRNLDGMGCTLVGLMFHNGGLSWISIGDSPLFLWRRGELRRLNEDHSMAPVFEKLADVGELSALEVSNHPQRNALRSAVTGGYIDIIDLPSTPISLMHDDVVICGSDGMLSLSESEITQVLNSSLGSSATDIANRLLQDIINKGKPRQDNVTIQVFLPNSSDQSKRSKKIQFRISIVSIAAVLILTMLFVLDSIRGSSSSTGFLNYLHQERPKRISPVPIDLPYSEPKYSETIDTSPPKNETIERTPNNKSSKNGFSANVVPNNQPPETTLESQIEEKKPFVDESDHSMKKFDTRGKSLFHEADKKNN